ncbi:unnamed protein product [Owenia fusiformis]|uniref:Galaxin-like repeats domain-containing protein n=1 Tax=Owenia fusiformis TaxID=6347 RepID=A0A8J1TBV5_OWEFU|nr:unnamed protein product [Owenia fusiformis]
MSMLPTDVSITSISIPTKETPIKETFAPVFQSTTEVKTIEFYGDQNITETQITERTTQNQTSERLTTERDTPPLPTFKPTTALTMGCIWSSWGSYIDRICSKPCGSGILKRTRTRNKMIGSSTDPSHCIGSSVDISTIICNTIKCCIWSKWSSNEYVTCTKPCGTGIKLSTRTRTRMYITTGNSPICTGESIRTNTAPCNTKQCCNWGNWGSYQFGPCSKTCGRGKHTGRRTRKKVNSSIGTTPNCKGSPKSTFSRSCNTQPCLKTASARGCQRCDSSCGRFPANTMCCFGCCVTRTGVKSSCCGKRSYDTSGSLCCGGKIVSKTGFRSQCCGTRSYDTSNSLCCGGKVVSKTGFRSQCCGRRSYDTTNSLCCDGVIQAKPGFRSACCCKKAYDTSKAKCCSGCRICSNFPWN